MKLKRFSTWTMMLAGFVLASVFLLCSYSELFSHYFWDEDDFIYVSFAIEHNSPAYIFGREYYVQMFPRPVTHMYFWLLSLIAGTVIWPYFLANLLLYAASSVLVFSMVRKISSNVMLGVSAGLFYLFSPCATDNLYWVAAGATGFLSGFLLLLTANIYLHPHYRSDLKLRFLSLLTAILALGAKESAFSLPFLLTLLEFTVIRSREGRWKRLIPFYAIGALFAINVLIVQLSYADNANFTRYGLSWMIPRNMLHFIIYPLVGAMPPNIGQYTLFKMVFYPLLWLSPLVIGTGRSRRLMFQGFTWTAISSLPFLPWIMAFEGFLPRICDIPSRYFNIPSIGSSMVVVAFILALRSKAGRIPALVFTALMLAALALSGVIWTHDNTDEMVESGQTARCLMELALSCWNGSGHLYVGAFGFKEPRIDSYNRMYFNGMLIQCEPLPADVPVGTRFLCGPKGSPGLLVLHENGWRVEQTFDSCDMSSGTREPD